VVTQQATSPATQARSDQLQIALELLCHQALKITVIGGSAGMGLETARRAREEGAELILTGRNAGHLKQAAADVGARDIAAFDATDPAALGQFFAGLPGPVDRVTVTGPGPYYAPLADLDHARAISDFDGHLWLRAREHTVISGASRGR
jgi:NAD(P)-dependent dehydrogenase (short-subunit alcohol dehydrogenase family)